ncbi:F-box only protein 17 [Myotis brandtii]|uniref:F-box only protein 17 n=2 Tax=Myotis TaxID=9434 RepID=S7NSN0_MYOBR|nr:F-box only protein 17 [Myotis brandtii]
MFIMIRRREPHPGAAPSTAGSFTTPRFPLSPQAPDLMGASEEKGEELPLKGSIIKVVGNEIKLEKPKEKDSKKDGDARTLLAKKSALCGKVTQDELKEVFEDAMEIRLVSKDGKNKGIAYIEFKTEADAEKTLEEKQGTEIDGRSISLYYTGKVKIETIGMERTALGVPTKTLFVKGLSEETAEETLKESFDGSVRARIVTYRETGSSKWFGFVNFNSEGDAKAAKEAWKMVKLMETKLLWTGPSLRVKVVSGVMVEAEVALEVEAGEVLKVEEAEEEEETISHKERRRKGFRGWEVEHGGNGWAVEKNLTLVPGAPSQTCFVTSFEWCFKRQLVDLVMEGVWQELLDSAQIEICVADWWGARENCGCIYRLRVRLLDVYENEVVKFSASPNPVLQWTERGYRQVSHVFTNFGKGIRYVSFEQYGRDTRSWVGHYGALVTHSSVRVRIRLS